MTKRRVRLIVATVTVAAFIGIVLGMRSVASWRPQTIMVLPDKSWWASHISDDGRFLVMGHDPSGKQSTDQIQFTTLDLQNGHRAKWPIFENLDMESDFTTHLYWRSWTRIRDDKRGESEYEAEPVKCVLDIFEVKTGRLLKRMRWTNGLDEFVQGLQFTRNGQVLRVLSDDSLFDWNLKATKPQARVHLQNKVVHQANFDSDMVPQVFSPDATEVLGGSDSNCCIWDARSGKILRSWKDSQKPGGSCIFSPNTQIVVFNDQQSNFFRFYESHSGKILWETFAGTMFGVSFSPDSQLIFVVKKDGCEVHEAHSGRLLHRLRGPRVQDLKDGGVLLANADWVYTQNQRGEVQRWRVR